MNRRPTTVALATLLCAAGLAAGQTAAPGPIFATADRCIACHNNLITPAGDDISMGVDWRASMMANAARDPYWQAAIRREVLEHPSAQAAIEHECGACHVPMHRFQAKAAGLQGQVFAHLPAHRTTTPESLLAVDGVSCTLCHQITDEGLGEEASYTAGFAVDTAAPMGERHIFGPWEIDPGRSTLMSSASLFSPRQGAHLQTSELCATCHTLYTHALDDQGRAVGELPEQVPYLEWKHSAHAGVRSCQSCHMPVVEGETEISGVMGLARAEVSRHVFRGGNFFVPRLLNRHRTELGVAALPQELEITSQRTAAHLQSAAARLAITGAERAGDTLEARVRVTNLAGHKLPSAYPSRRAWIHLEVRSGSGEVVFSSGRLQADGAIAGNDNDADPARYEPHHAEITSADQVQIYEAILADPAGAVTTVLLSAVRYAKDSRLLPEGFDKGTAHPDIAVAGAASDDPDFVGGGDTVAYTVELGDGDGPYTVSAELLYQPIGHRWAHNLALQQAAEVDLFVAAYREQAAASAVVLAADRVTVP